MVLVSKSVKSKSTVQ